MIAMHCVSRYHHTVKLPHHRASADKRGDVVETDAIDRLASSTWGEDDGVGIARSGYPVFTAEHELAGYVTSGSYSPTLKKPIALALLDSSYATIGQEFLVEVRHRKVQAKSVKTPFYRRPPR
ncbi:glycine cleavage T C-terminal barrel domain-containing protein [Sulfobacillus thermotolerans]|uniref:glycine cleavage T C-terminal barrel domain-containing protein n=1 Tax=Sulfobacillus thermotolerans TaxID=338644 RepID=UPI0033678080